MLKRFSFAAALLLIISGFPHLQVNAITKLPEPPTGKTVESSDKFLEGIYSGLSKELTPFYGWAVDLFTVLFVIGTIVMILSIAFKNGQWQKYAQGTMMITFIIMLLMRGLPIIVLSINSTHDIDSLFIGGVSLLSSIAIMIAVMSIGISADFKFNYHMIEHPKYHRWSRNLFSVAILMTVLSILVPWIFPQV